MERFVDEAEKPMPPADTWDDLSTNDLIDVKLRLSNNLQFAKKHPQMMTVINQGIARITRIISQRDGTYDGRV